MIESLVISIKKEIDATISDSWKEVAWNNLGIY